MANEKTKTFKVVKYKKPKNNKYRCIANEKLKKILPFADGETYIKSEPENLTEHLEIEERPTERPTVYYGPTSLHGLPGVAHGLPGVAP